VSAMIHTADALLSRETAEEGQDVISVLDLFAGAGGLSQGLHEAEAGFRTVGAVELDQVAARTYQTNHRTEVHVGTVLDWLKNGVEPPKVDVIVGGPPCQGFSTLGKQDAEDARNELWSEYVEAILWTEPAYFVVENVAMFLRSPQFQQFRKATDPEGELRDWTFQARVLNAADYGSYQVRHRAVVLGHRRDLQFPGWPEPTHAEKHLTVRQALRGIPERWNGIDLPDRSAVINGREYPGPFRSDELHLGRHYSSLSLKRFAEIPPGGNRFDLPDHLKSPCWLKHLTGSGDVMGRLHWDRPSVTIRTEFFKPEKGRYLHPIAHRALTHYEAATLQGFPCGYQWFGSKTAIARQIGNAVPIQLGRAIGRQLAKALGRSPSPRGDQ